MRLVSKYIEYISDDTAAILFVNFSIAALGAGDCVEAFILKVQEPR